MKTARDVTDYLIDFLGENPTGQALKQAKVAASDALTELANASNWSYYYRSGRIATQAPYSTGTIAYTHTGGAYERVVTLTGGTFPTWATQGQLYLGLISYEVEEYKSATQLTLTVNSNPGADVAAGTSYNLFQDFYPLPADFKTAYAVTVASNLAALAHVHPTRWHDLVRNFRSQGIPTTFTIMGDPNYLDVLSMGLFPYPNNAYQIDFVYQRRPRIFQNWEEKAGTLTLTSGSALAEGSGTAFIGRHQGCTLRVSADATNYPTGLDGASPYNQEFQVLAVNSGTELRLDNTSAANLTGVKYILSDPVDVDSQLMFTVFLRCAEKHLSIKRRLKEAPLIARAYAEALLEARAGDSRYAQRWGLDPDRYRVRWANHPIGADVS